MSVHLEELLCGGLQCLEVLVIYDLRFESEIAIAIKSQY